jgi:hypothetical protein
LKTSPPSTKSAALQSGRIRCSYSTLADDLVPAAGNTVLREQGFEAVAADVARAAAAEFVELGHLVEGHAEHFPVLGLGVAQGTAQQEAIVIAEGEDAPVGQARLPETDVRAEVLVRAQQAQTEVVAAPDEAVALSAWRRLRRSSGIVARKSGARVS